MTLLLADELDISRGDLIAIARDAPVPTDVLDATLAWLADKPLLPGARVLVKHGTRTVQALVERITARFDEQRLALVDGPDSLVLNEIGLVTLRTAEPLAVDDYTTSRRTGAFLVIDPADGGTLAAGLVGAALPILRDRATTPPDDLVSPGP